MVTLTDLKSRGRQLEFGCYVCGLHQYVDVNNLIDVIPPDTQIPDIANLMRCPQCQSVNREPGYPLWTRPDARPPLMGAAAG